MQTSILYCIHLKPLTASKLLKRLHQNHGTRHKSDIIHNGSHCIRIDYGHNVVEQ